MNSSPDKIGQNVALPTSAGKERVVGVCWAIVALLMTIISAWFAAGTTHASTMTVRDYSAGQEIHFDTCTIDSLSLQPFDGEQFFAARCEGETILPIGRPMWVGITFDEVAIDLQDWQGCALVLWVRYGADEHVEFDCGGVTIFSDGLE